MKLINRPELRRPSPGDLMIKIGMKEVAPGKRKQEIKRVVIINRVEEKSEGCGEFFIYYSSIYPKKSKEYFDDFEFALRFYQKYQKAV